MQPRACPHMGYSAATREVPRLIATRRTFGQERLQHEPADVAEFVDWTNFLRETNGRLKEFSERGMAIHAMYNLMSDYSVAVPDADAASVKMMDSMLSNLSHLVQQVRP